MDTRAADRAVQGGERPTVGLLQCSALEPGFPIVHASPSFELLTGYTEAEVIGRSCRILQGPETDPGAVAVMARTLRTGGECRVVVRNYRKDGSAFWNEVFLAPVTDADGRIVRYIGVQHDVTGRRESEAELARQALQDPLTGLPNRRLLQDRVTMALERAARDGGACVAMLVADLDGFKRVNDTLGHGAGDDLLRQAAARLQANLRGADTVARLGGDEFAVLCEAALGDAVGAVAGRVARSFAAPFEVDGHRLLVSASIGIAVADGGHATMATLLQDADAAMYRAKRRGAGLVEVFEPSMRAADVRRFELEVELNRALEDGTMHVEYQPKVDLATGAVRYVEALARWHHPERGPISPVAFIPVAEAAGLIGRIGEHVLATACRDAAAWRAAHRPWLGFCVNLSAAELGSDALVEHVEGRLCEHGLEPAVIGFEWTETSALTDHARVEANLRALRELGSHLAIDDFGTGHASLTHLRDFPAHELKIDRSFVASAGDGDDARDRALREAVVGLAHGFGITSTAEGIETPEQLAALRRMGCDQGQGFLLARPGRFESLAARIAGAGEAVRAAAA
jgi:diguanylate cyclase (GGDEF)-like protein/PAS domain S-box-containing protein